MPVTKSSGESWGSGGGSYDDSPSLDAFGGAGAPVGYGGSGYGTFDPNQGDDGGYVAPSSNIGVANAVNALLDMSTVQQNQLSLPQVRQAQNLFQLAQNAIPSSGYRDMGFVQSRTPNYNMYSQPFNMPQPAEVAGLLSRFDELANRMTGVKFGRMGGDISSLENLAIRAGQAPSPDKPLGFKYTSGLSQRMYDDIMNKDYIPQYDAAGQIVATINPKTGQLGVGSVESRIDYNNPDTVSERDRLEGSGVSILDDFGMGRTSRDETPEVPEYLLRGQGGGVAEPVTQDISMIPTGQIAAGGTPMYRQTLLDVAPTQYGGLLAGTTPSDFDVANRAFRMTGATYPEYFQDPYNLTGYSILT